MANQNKRFTTAAMLFWGSLFDCEFDIWSLCVKAILRWILLVFQNSLHSGISIVRLAVLAHAQMRRWNTPLQLMYPTSADGASQTNRRMWWQNWSKLYNLARLIAVWRDNRKRAESDVKSAKTCRCPLDLGPHGDGHWGWGDVVKPTYLHLKPGILSAETDITGCDQIHS